MPNDEVAAAMDVLIKKFRRLELFMK